MTDTRIETFGEALDSDDPAAATDAFGGFDDAVREQRELELAINALARVVMAREPQDSEAVATAQEYRRKVYRADRLRPMAKLEYVTYLDGGYDDGTPVAERVAEVAAAREAVRSAAADLREQVGDMDLPAVIAVFGPDGLRLPKGASIETSVTVTNPGVTAAQNLSISVEGYDLTPDPSTIDALPAGEEVSVTLAGTADEVVDTQITLEIPPESVSIRLEVLDAAGFLESALELLGEVEGRLDGLQEDGDDPGGGPPGIEGLANKIETARKRIERLIEVAENGGNGGGNGNGRGSGNGGGNSLANRIRSVMQLLGAFINQVESLTDEGFPEREGALLIDNARGVIEELELATRAEC